VKTGSAAARKRLHAQVPLKADEGESGQAWTDAAIMKALEVDTRIVERLHQRLVEEGLERTLSGHPQHGSGEDCTVVSASHLQSDYRARQGH